MNVKKFLPIAVVIVLVVIIQLFTTALDVQYYLTQLTMAAYYSLVAIGLCMFMGYAGQISIGQAGFFAIGGYTTATLSTVNLASRRGGAGIEFLTRIRFLTLGEDLYGSDILYISPWIAVMLAVVITVIIAAAIGFPVLRLKGHYLAMATLGFGIIIYRIVLGTRLFGEADGISNVPGFRILPKLIVNGDFASRVSNYYIAWGFGDNRASAAGEPHQLQDRACPPLPPRQRRSRQCHGD